VQTITDSLNFILISRNFILLLIPSNFALATSSITEHSSSPESKPRKSAVKIVFIVSYRQFESTLEYLIIDKFNHRPDFSHRSRNEECGKATFRDEKVRDATRLFILFAFSFLSHSKKSDVGQEFLLRMEATTKCNEFPWQAIFFGISCQCLVGTDIQLSKIHINVLLIQVFNYHRKYYFKMSPHNKLTWVSSWVRKKKITLAYYLTMIIASYNFELLKQRRVYETHKNVYNDRRILNRRTIHFSYL